MDGDTKPVKSVTTLQKEAAIVQAYLCAKKQILNSPYNHELVGATKNPADLSESQFLRELAWVILSSGMAESVIRNKFPDISISFLGWESARCISENAEQCVANALCHFRHRGKIRAIADAAIAVFAAGSFEHLKSQLLCDPIQKLQSFAYIGPVTAFHLAKNIGIPVVKPDRHLTRLARSNGYSSAAELCGSIACYLGEDLRLVDSVLWRFATMHRDYSARFSSFYVA